MDKVIGLGSFGCLVGDELAAELTPTLPDGDPWASGRI